MLKRLWKYYTLLGLITPLSLSAQTNSFPYEQNFESFSLCTANCRFSCNLTEQWQNDTEDDTDWSIGTETTPTPNTGPPLDFSPATSWGKYLYIEASNGCQGGAEASIISPYFDLRSLSQPMISFAYHMWGQGQGSLHLDVDTSGVWINDIMAPLHANQNEWQVLAKCLTWLADANQVRFRIRGITGRSETSDMAIDAFKIYEAHPQDIALLHVSAANCNHDNQENLQITYENQGVNPLPALAVSFSVNNGRFSQPEIIPAGLAPCNTGHFSFRKKLNINTPGPHKITVAFQRLAQDPNPYNDTLTINLNPTPTITKFPYSESFEYGAGNWSVSGTNASWRWGIPAGNWISQASEGRYAWFNENGQGTYNNAEYSYLTSPNFDLSTYSHDPVLIFDHSFQIEFMLDSSWMEYSLDGGESWMKMGRGFTSIENWYNNASDQVWTGNSLAGGGQWQTTAVHLNGLAGNCVRFRFVLFTDNSIRREGVGIDHVRIMLPYDVAVTAIESPYDVCGGSWGQQESVRIRVKNKGYFPISNLQLSYDIDSSGTYISPESLLTSLQSGDSSVFTFRTKANIATLGRHHINVKAILPQDGDSLNNILHQSAGNYPLPTVNIGNDTIICKGNWVKFKSQIQNAQSYLWSDGSTGSSLLTGKRGQHKLQVIDQNGCKGSDSVYLDLFPQPQIRVNFMESVRCYGDSTGILDLSLYGSVPPYTFNWDDGSSTLYRKNLPAGFYPFILTDQIGCSLRDSIYLRQNDSLFVDLNKITPSGCPMDSSGKVDVDIVGGQEPYHYIWSNGSMQEDLTKVLDGTYSVMVVDAFGCATYSEDYEILPSDTLPQARFGYNVSGGTVTIIDSSTNTTSQTFLFGDGSEPIEGQNASVKYTYSQNGVYQIELVAENSCGKDTFILEIEVDAVSIDNPELASILNVGPNPVNQGFFYLHFTNPKLEYLELSLYDLNGKNCLFQRWDGLYRSGTERIDIPVGLASGYYLVEMNTPLGRLRKKLLIQH